MASWVEKLLNVLLKAAVGVITGGGVFSAASGSWFGAIVFQRFAATHDIQLMNADLIPYEKWNAKLLFDALGTGILPAIVCLALLIGMLAHVVFKTSRENDNDDTSGGDRPRSSETRWRKLARTVGVYYRRCYYRFTVLLFVLLVLLLWAASNLFWLVGLFVIVALPAAFYLLSYSKDAINGTFGKRFTYWLVALFFCIGLLSLSRRYGERFFEPEVWQVTAIQEQTVLDDGSIAFVFDRMPELLARLEFRRDGGITVGFEPVESGSVTMDPERVPLRRWAEMIAVPELPQVASAEEILSFDSFTELAGETGR